MNKKAGGDVLTLHFASAKLIDFLLRFMCYKKRCLFFFFIWATRAVVRFQAVNKEFFVEWGHAGTSN